MSLPDPRVLHLVVGPEQHGVVRHGVEVAAALGQPVRRAATSQDLRATLTDGGLLDGLDVVHVPFTDRLFAARAEEAAEAFEALVAPVLDRGLALSVTLHDLPAGDDPLDVRRRAAYDRVVRRCAGVVVSSRRELELVGRLDEHARSVRVVPLPVDPVPRPDVLPTAQWARAEDVVVLGFLFPDRGYEAVLDALPAGVDLLALGRPSAGHEELPDAYAARAAADGHGMRTSGFVEDADLAAELWAAGIPVAPNRRVAASGSIGTWVAHGRRPLVPATAYTRELAERWPGALRLYDPDEPAALRDALAEAVADPRSTWVADPGVVGPRSTEVAAGYRRHFLGCGPERALTLGGGRVVVPGNRWDLAPTRPEPVSVSVVVPHYDAQHDLDLVLTALTLQDHPRLEVVVADDGSPEPPSLAAAGDLPVTLVRQERRGFRAAAARNLGARAASGEVLLFVDGDTVPEPGYVSRLAALPAAVPDALVVGRRRHADLAGWSTVDLRDWLSGAPSGRPPVELDEPSWLRDAYAESGDLLRADARSYRYVISAVMGLHRDLFAEVGGFDERFTSYGGEDWELAHRLWVAGAVVAHVPGAVAWHDGPDWAGRPAARRGAKNAEWLALTRLLPDAAARGGGAWALPAVTVELGFTEPAAVLATARSAYAGDTDCGLWLTGDPDEAARTAGLLEDPRLHVGEPDPGVRGRAATRVHVRRPAALVDLTGLARTAELAGPLVSPTATVTPARATYRSGRWADALGVDPDELALRLFGGRDVLGPAPTDTDEGGVDLPHELTVLHRRAAARTRPKNAH